MSKFNNESYLILVNDLVGDAFYSNTSYRDKISKIRQYTEVIVRKLLDINPNKKITLGQTNIQKKIRLIPNYNFIEKPLQLIIDEGNPCSHTQRLNEVSIDNYNEVVDGLFDMLSILLINYFENYEFGTRNDVLTSFSLLPPIIRYKVLNYLYEKDPKNICIIDKLILAIMKAFDEIAQKNGIEFAKLIQSTLPQNMYQSCKMKISQVGAFINDNGLLYLDFESALPFYKENGILSSADDEAKEFNDVMNFLYLGRKDQLNNLQEER